MEPPSSTKAVEELGVILRYAGLDVDAEHLEKLVPGFYALLERVLKANRVVVADTLPAHILPYREQ